MPIQSVMHIRIKSISDFKFGLVIVLFFRNSELILKTILDLTVDLVSIMLLENLPDSRLSALNY